MKKVILIASLVVLASCKKEKEEPAPAPTSVVDCKCGEITYVDWVYSPQTQGQAVNLYVTNDCTGNTFIFSKTQDIYSQLLGDQYCHSQTW